VAKNSLTPKWLTDLLRPGVITEKSRNPKLFKLACDLKRNGLSDAELTRTLLQYNEDNCRPPKTDAEVLDIAKRVCATYVPPVSSRGRGQKKILHCMYFDVIDHKANDRLQALKSHQRGWWFELFTGAWLRKGYLPSDIETLAYIAAIAPEERSQFAAEYQTVLTAGGFELLTEGPSGSPQYIHHSLACLYSEKYEVVEKEIDRREESKRVSPNFMKRTRRNWRGQHDTENSPRQGTTPRKIPTALALPTWRFIRVPRQESDF